MELLHIFKEEPHYEIVLTTPLEYKFIQKCVHEVRGGIQHEEGPANMNTVRIVIKAREDYLANLRMRIRMEERDLPPGSPKTKGTVEKKLITARQWVEEFGFGEKRMRYYHYSFDENRNPETTEQTNIRALVQWASKEVTCATKMAIMKEYDQLQEMDTKYGPEIWTTQKTRDKYEVDMNIYTGAVNYIYKTDTYHWKGVLLSDIHDRLTDHTMTCDTCKDIREKKRTVIDF